MINEVVLEGGIVNVPRNAVDFVRLKTFSILLLACEFLP